MSYAGRSLARVVRLREYQTNYKGVPGPIVYDEEMPSGCPHGLHYRGSRPCSGCGLSVVQFWCGKGCPAVVDPDHVHGDPTEYATVVRLDGTLERVER